MSRAEFAEAVNKYLWRMHGQRRELDSHTIARYERGIVRWPNANYREAFRAVLQSTDAELGFVPSRRRRASTRQPDSTLAVDLFSPFDPNANPFLCIDRRPSDGKPVERVGWSEVKAIEDTTRAVASAENLRGGGSVSVAAGKQLGQVLRLLDGRAEPVTRRALLEAIGNLSSVAGYAAFDGGDIQLAERRFRLALWCADAAGSWELRASVLADLARKTAYVGNADGALSLIELARVRSDRLSATARAMLSALRAQFLGAIGRIDEALSEVQRSDEHLAERRPETDAPWLCYYDRAEHLGSTGKALISVARARRRIEPAAQRIREAVALQGPDYPRSRTFSLTRLATLTMELDDPREASAIGLQAVEHASTFSSSRIRNELRALAAATAPRRRISAVAVLHDAIANSSAMESP
ncbi:XRE family transcriptional regulator [Nocardia sp. NBC_00508]|uniref:XRE family transcriptional regulator n=1 Tax=Nocardia sp. NBC_00508 TaxID=2975992 RepID=UPI002E82374B|nr:XRE family transcriptional regulator [Nocardia sp. NBC_00508]WUD63718.1 XRE family transcriptional regulator [Nocardia sp. NBC_00508]